MDDDDDASKRRVKVESGGRGRNITVFKVLAYALFHSQEGKAVIF
jgi:hypothetical protein